MNKRIQKLFNEAGFHQPEMERLGIEDKFEKFAQLIVMECERVVCDKFDETEPWMYPGDLMKHFGINKEVKNDND
jgi:hypothetical protein